MSPLPKGIYDKGVNRTFYIFLHIGLIQMKNILKGSLILTSSNLIIRVAGYLYRILMGRMLSPYEFGILNLALPIQYMVIILASSGIAPGIAKFVSEFETKKDVKKRDVVISSSVLYFTLIGTVIGAVFYLLSDIISIKIFHDGNVAAPLKISSIAIPFGILIASFTGTFQGFKRFDLMGVTLVIEQVLRILFAVIFVSIGFQAIGAIGGSTLGFMLTVPAAYLIFRKSGLSLKFSRADFNDFKKILRFSIPISVTALAAAVLGYVDVILLGYYLSPVEVGIYSAASPTSRVVLAFSTALYATLIPEISGLKARKEIKKYYLHSVGMSLLVLVPVTLVSLMLSEFIITLLFGAAYVGAAGPFEVLVVGTAFFGIFILNSGIFQGMGMPGVPMKILIVTAFLDIVLNVVLIQKYQMMGAAAASTLSFAFAGVVSSLVLITVLKRKI